MTPLRDPVLLASAQNGGFFKLFWDHILPGAVRVDEGVATLDLEP